MTRIPVTALMTRGDRSNVTIVDTGIIQFYPIRVSATDGANISVVDDLLPGEQIAVNLPDEVIDGSRIQPVITK